MWRRYVNLMEEDPVYEKIDNNISAKEEVESYLNKANMNPDTNVFKFWDSNTEYPRLKNVSC